jgi:hypothetical protein
MEAVGGLFGKGATEAAESGAADATDEAAAETEAAGARSESEGSSCKTGSPHSFTGGTPVLMAGGGTKPIDQVKVGDTIADSVPGAAGTQAHKVTAVIVTTTDHDFVDLTVKTSTTAAAAAKVPLKARASAAAKTITKAAAKKAAYGLAASAAILATLGATHHATDHTAPTAAVSPVTAQVDHLTTTFHHPFYDETQAAFVDAQDLHPGDTLQTPTGTAQITAVRLYHANTTTYDLTIGDQVTDGQVIAVGGSLPEREFATPGGSKGSRRPDVLVQRPDGSIYGINVGKQAMRSGAPIKREAEALKDLEEIGIPMHFAAYN